VVPKRFEKFLRFLCFRNFKSWDLGDEANPKSMAGCSELVVRGPHGRKVGKSLRKNMRKPHFRGRGGRKVTNMPRMGCGVGVPVSFAGARVRWVWVCVGRHRGSGVTCIQWGHPSNTRPRKPFLHVEHPRPPPPRGTAAVLVLDGRCGNGHGSIVRSTVIVRNSSE
jgi:hypothetical protein